MQSWTHNTSARPKRKKKDKIQSDVRIVPTQQQVDGQQLLPLFVLLDFQGAAGVLVRGREDKRRGVTGTRKAVNKENQNARV